MGPSGSGKTTLLNVLAGQVAASPRLSLSGFLEVNGQRKSKKSYRYDELYMEQILSKFNHGAFLFGFCSFKDILAVPGMLISDRKTSFSPR